MKKYFLALLIATGCTSGDKEPPPNLLTQEQMVAFLIDSHMAEGQLQALKVPQDSLGPLYPKIEAELFTKHGFDSLQFIASYHYYLDHADELMKIYDAVIDSLSLREKVLSNTEQ